MAIIGKWVKATAMLEVNQKQQALRQKYIIAALCGAGILLLCIALALI